MDVHMEKIMWCSVDTLHNPHFRFLRSEDAILDSSLVIIVPRYFYHNMVQYNMMVLILYLPVVLLEQ